MGGVFVAGGESLHGGEACDSGMRMEASVPPAVMASASPRWMMRKASPMEWALEVQAVAVYGWGRKRRN